MIDLGGGIIRVQIVVFPRSTHLHVNMKEENISATTNHHIRY